jgi:hypothetical protein
MTPSEFPRPTLRSENILHPSTGFPTFPAGPRFVILHGWNKASSPLAVQKTLPWTCSSLSPATRMSLGLRVRQPQVLAVQPPPSQKTMLLPSSIFTAAVAKLWKHRSPQNSGCDPHWQSPVRPDVCDVKIWDANVCFANLQATGNACRPNSLCPLSANQGGNRV